MIERARAVEAFLAAAGWAGAERRPLADDASFRRYARVRQEGRAAVLMDAPSDKEDVRPFVRIANLLRAWGLSAPAVLAEDAASGLLLLEDLGDAGFIRLLDEGGDEAMLYQAAVDVLLALRERAVPADVPPYDDKRLLEEALLFTDWYLPALTGAPTYETTREQYIAHWLALFPRARHEPPRLTLRDYHADNLVWLADRAGPARVGLLDFQDAVVGPAAYDLVSLLEDARRDVAPALAEAMLARYLERAATDADTFRAAYAILGAQRNAKIIGIFTRLWRRDGKPRYLELVPRVWRLLEGDLAHPVLEAMRAWFDRTVPSPARRAPRSDERP